MKKIFLLVLFATTASVSTLYAQAVCTANNTCATAYTLTHNSGCVTSTYNTASCTDENAVGECTNGTAADNSIWFKFVAAGTSATVTATAGTGQDIVIGAITACGSATTPTGGGCTDAAVSAGTETLTLTGLTIGNTYYIVLHEYYAVTASGTICVSGATVVPPQGSTTCATPTKLCSVTGQTLTFGATVGAANASVTNPGNNYGCLSTTPRPSWFYLEIENSGSLDITLQGYDTGSAVVDNDFALWGPFANIAAAQAACNSYTAGSSTTGLQMIDCSYAGGTGSESINIPSTATAGQVFVLLVTAYSSSSATFTLAQQATSTGTTSCSGVAGACDISNVTLSNLSVCNGNATTLATDDYYTADVTVTFTNKPATGNIQLTGAGIHTAVTPVAVASTTTATTHVFTGVRIKADGTSQTIRADFSALTGCNFIKSGIAAVNSCSCAAGTMILNVTTP
jgi:trimeric autotransporter adhesin